MQLTSDSYDQAMFPGIEQRLGLSRRGFLVSGAAVVSAAWTLPSAPACTLVSEQEVGPYYIDYEQIRQDLTEGKAGVPLRLRIGLIDAKSCAPLMNAALDIWHCDALGVYSGYTSNSPDGGGPGARGGRPFGPPPGGARAGRFGSPPAPKTTDNKRFLRGVQVTDKRGIAEFATLYPGWYSGRAIHIHLKVHLGGGMAEEKYAGGHVCHTGQLFFPEEITERVAKIEPYSKRLEVHRTTQEEDNIFSSQGGGASMLSLERLTKGADGGGFIANVALAVDPDATPGPVRGFGPGRPPTA